ncbi:MAG: hypothetical protein PHY87_03025 [Sphaerochaeta sp.]|uniref:hypothetical protein n=1 Tax=Sphaerochaeta sp. TaxID=1972642 RepID=UPI002970AA29|nr:hypothetical protein [Sphaerochaeta sp.]MDD3928748.1 hypothetical protein [Sphaerochaeta sp.]
MKRLLLITLFCFSFSMLWAQTNLNGSTGYLVVSSAEITKSTNSPAVTTAYSATFSKEKVAHIPSVLLSFKDTFETSLAVDIAQDTDLLVNAKWRFAQKGTTSFAVGLLGQISSVSLGNQAALQIYAASTFESSIMDRPSKTTILLGYSVQKEMNSNINFALAFQTPFFADTFHDKVVFLLDFGNVSYSATPSFSDADDRGLVNVGLRLIPFELVKSVHLGLELRALDLFDHEGRALSLGAAISFQPN